MQITCYSGIAIAYSTELSCDQAWTACISMAHESHCHQAQNKGAVASTWLGPLVCNTSGSCLLIPCLLCLNFIPNLSSLLHWLPLCLTVFVVFDHVMTINAESLTCCTGCCSIDLFVLTQLLTKTQYFQLCWCFCTLQMWPFRAKVSPHKMVSLT